MDQILQDILYRQVDHIFQLAKSISVYANHLHVINVLPFTLKSVRSL